MFTFLPRHVSRGVVVLVALGALSGCGKTGNAAAGAPPSTPYVPVVKAERRDLTSTLQIASELLPYQEIDVHPKVSGYVQKLNINWGTHVRQGQLMAVLDIPELQQQIHYDEAAIRGAESELARVQEEQSRVQSSYAVAHVTYTRLSGVWDREPGLISKEELDVAQGKDAEASASVAAAKEALQAQKQAVSAAQATLRKDRVLFAYSQIVAPFNGVVTRLNAYTGALLPGNGELSLCHLSQNDLLRLVIPVPERSVPDVHLGDSIAVDVSTINKTFQGRVARFSDQIDVTTRTMHTEIDVPNPQYILVPGMYASVKLPLRTIPRALVLPLQGIQSNAENKGSILVVNSGNTLERREVALGTRTATDVQVLSDLQENEMVVFGEQSQYKPGEHVNPKLVQPQQVD